MAQTKRGYSVPPGWGLCVGPITSTPKNVYVEKKNLGRCLGRTRKKEKRVRPCGKGLRENKGAF
jgi:hypothetical protein